MIRAVIKGLQSPDIQDLDSWTPPPDGGFSFLLEIMAGLRDEPGEERFQIVVCDLEWLRAQLPERRWVAVGRHLVLQGYDYSLLRSAAEELVATAAAEAKTWNEFALRLNEYAEWEFDNYQP
jgi:hypothetical protein